MNKPSLVIAMLLLATVPVAGQAQVVFTDRAAAVREFVRLPHVEGVPYEEAVRLDRDVAIPVLLAMLNDPKEEAHWANVVMTLGMIGDPRAVKPLLDFLNRDAGPLSFEHYRAKTCVLLALGYLSAAAASTDEAMQTLIDGTDPSTWKKRGIAWRAPFQSNDAERDRQLATMSILGLGLSGRPRAAEHLRLRIGDKGPLSTVPSVDDVLRESLQANEIIATRGIREYYRRKGR